MTEADHAYIAGLWDGEGSYVIAKHFSKTEHCGKREWVWELRMTISMGDREGLEFIRKKFGKKRLRVSKRPNGKEFYHITLYSNELRKVLPKLIPFARVKRKQAKLLYRAVSIITPKSSKEVDEQLEEMYLKMKQLNNSRFLPI